MTHYNTVFTHPHVLVEAGTLAKAFVTDTAFMWPVFLVHMKDMNSKSISFFKRSTIRKTSCQQKCSKDFQSLFGSNFSKISS